MGKFSSLLGIGAPGGGGGLKSSLIQQAKEKSVLPKRGDKEVTDASARARAAAKLRRGRKSTILTGGGGLKDKLGSVGSPEASSL